MYPERFCLNAGFIATPKLSGNETDEQKRLDEVIETLNCLQDATHNFFGTQIQPLLSFDVIRKADVNAKLEEPEITIIPSGEELLEMITSDDQPTTEIVPVTSEFEGSGSSHSQPPAKKRRRIKYTWYFVARAAQFHLICL